MAIDQSSDNNLIRLVLAGNQDAFRSLVERYFETVRMVALAKTGNIADAEDVAQETFLKAYQTLGALRDREKFAPWLVTIGRNLAVSTVRKRERERRTVPEACHDTIEPPDFARRERLAAVARQVETLPVNLREVVLLHYFEGLKCREIADRLDLTTAAVLKRLSRGRDLLGDRLLREWGEGARGDSASINRVMGALVVLPKPDWNAQSAAFNATGSKAAAITTLGGAPLSKAGLGAMSLAVAATITIAFFVVRQSTEVTATPGRATANTAEPRGGFETTADTDEEGTGETLTRRPDDRVAISLTQPPARAEVGFIAGTVRGTSGAPIAGANITASSRGAQGKAVTDPNGAFRVNISAPKPQIEVGDVSKALNVLAAKSGYVTLVTRDVAMGAADVHLVIRQPAVVRGQVVDASTGAPVPQFSLRIDGPGPIVRPDTGETVNSHWREVHARDGQFTLDGDFGIKTLDVVAPGYVGATLALGLAQDEVEEGVVVSLNRGGAIAGFVYDKESRGPLDNAHVIVREDGQSVRQNYSDTSDERGTFALEGVSFTSSVQLEVWKPGFRRQFVPVEVAAADAPIEIYLDHGGTVRGRVTNQGGPPPASQNAKIEDGYCMVRVSVMEDGGGQGQFAYVQPDGTYEVTGLEPGLYMAGAYYWPCDYRNDCNSMSRLVMVREGGTTTLDLSYDDEGGDLKVLLGDTDAGFDAWVELRSPLEPESILAQDIAHERRPRTFPRTAHFARLEPGEYLLRVYLPGSEDRAMEELVRITAGRTLEMAVELGGSVVDDRAIAEEISGP